MPENTEAHGRRLCHLEKDVCIAVGEMAKYGVRINRGRQTTHEETLEIFRKAEENGLVHH